jgi:3',5'-cyclic AMP phosphodiesterase CpdA
VRASDLERAESALRDAAPGALRVVAVHHQLAGAPWRWRKLPLVARSRVLERLAAAGAELVIGGHTHQTAICERRDFEVLDDGARSCVLATAPGLGRPRSGRRYEVRGVLVHRADAGSISIETNAWRDGEWVPTATRTFPRG